MDIDTILMGRNTYHQLITELSPDVWVYDDFITYVITHGEDASSEKIIFTNENPGDLIKKLKKQRGKGIWICGGADIVQQLVNENLIDIYYITVIPTILGSGIRLFENGTGEIKLKLIHTQTYNGMKVYWKRNPFCARSYHIPFYMHSLQTLVRGKDVEYSDCRILHAIRYTVLLHKRNL